MKLFEEMPYLEDDQCFLREMKDSDAEALQHLMDNPRVYRYLPSFLYEQKYKDAHTVIRNMRRECFDTKDSIMLGIFRRSDPETMMGIAEIYGYDAEKEKASVGLRLDEPFWNAGVGRIVVVLLRNYLIRRIGLKTVTAHVMQGNKASDCMGEKTGFIRMYTDCVEDWGLGEPVIADKFIYKRKWEEEKQMSERTVKDACGELMELQKKMAAYDHAVSMIYYDGVTSAPKETAGNRAATLSVLSGEIYRLSTSEETVSLLEFLDAHKEELSQKEKRMVYLMLKDIREMQKIPMDEFVEFEELLVRADDIWHKAKEASDFALFCPYLEKIFETRKRFAGYIDPEKDPYDFCLNQYEEGLSTKTLDEFFGKLRASIVPLLKNVTEKPQIDDSIRFGSFPAAKQEELSYYLMKTIGLDFGHVGLSTTEHPFTCSLGSHLDERITTHYFEDDFVCSMYSVIHEGGHALYDTGSDEDLAYTVLDGGTSMSIHESQSRFYENIIGRSRSFCEYIFPKLCELFPEHFAGRTAEEFYRAVNKAQPSLIRTEADELTYCLHVMVRYELEKRVMAGELAVKDLPEEWNRLYKEYLGVDVPDDKHGVLQDSHWSGGMIGYFPSYALGSAYGAQFIHKMRETVDVDDCIRRGDFGSVNAWNRENIWKYGSLYTPAELLDRVLQEPFDPEYFIRYLQDKYAELY